MVQVLLSIISIGIIVIISELLLYEKLLHGELARKFVHISTGLVIASWAFYLSIGQIQFISLVLLVGVILSKYFNIFKSVHGVKRKTWGEAFFAIGIGLVATLAPNEWVYAIAILHMSLADGVAAIIGSAHGRTTSYEVFGHKKSIIGSSAFYITSVIITLTLVILSPSGTFENIGLILFLVPLTTTITENIAYNGVDNVVVPMAVLGVLQMISKISV